MQKPEAQQQETTAKPETAADAAERAAADTTAADRTGSSDRVSDTPTATNERFHVCSADRTDGAAVGKLINPVPITPVEPATLLGITKALTKELRGMASGNPGIARNNKKGEDVIRRRFDDIEQKTKEFLMREERRIDEELQAHRQDDFRNMTTAVIRYLIPQIASGEDTKRDRRRIRSSFGQ